MGIYIEGMEIPKDRPQLLWIYPNGKALTVQSDVDPWKELQAVPIPPHGRLIDADALGSFMYNMDFCDGGEADEWIQNAPTVIPASEEAE